MKKLAEILKRHIWCVMIIAVILFLWLFTLSFSKDVNLVSHLSLTSAVVSIVLAVIVIVYMYFQDQRSSENITEMRRLIDEGYQTMTDKASLVAEKAQLIDQRMAGLIQSPPTDSKPTTPPLETGEPLQFNASALSIAGLLVLHSVTKSYETRKPMSWKVVSSLIEESETSEVSYRYYGFGLFQCLKAFLGQGDIVWSLEQQEIKKLPDGFKKVIGDEINTRFEDYKKHNTDKSNRSYAYLEKRLIIIDDYFDNL